MATTEPQKWTATLGSTADVNAIPATTPSGSGRASFSGLFPPVTQLPLDQGGIAPERGDFNALFKYLGEYLFYLMQGGMFSYSTDYDYAAGNLVMHGGSLYLCIAANGPGSAVKYPTDTAYWRRLALLSDIKTEEHGVYGEQGWVRFHSGVQIVYGTGTHNTPITFPRAFNGPPAVSAACTSLLYPGIMYYTSCSATGVMFLVWDMGRNNWAPEGGGTYIAIGTWG